MACARAPKLLLAYRSAEAQGKAETAEFWLPNETKVQVEVLGKGQQFVSHGIHPDTRQPYVWTEQAPEDVPLASVPVVQPGRIADPTHGCMQQVNFATRRSTADGTNDEAQGARPVLEKGERWRCSDQGLGSSCRSVVHHNCGRLRPRFTIR